MVEKESQIYIELPIEKEFARLLRLMVSGIASRMDFDLDAVDDLKIAVEEAFLTAMRHHVESPVRICFQLGERELRIDFKGRIEPGTGTDSHVDDFSNFILEAVVDDLCHAGTETQFDLSLLKNV